MNKPRNGDVVRVEPVAGRTVRDPASGRIVAASRRVSWSAYWAGRLADGDIALVQSDTAKPAKPSKSKTEETE